MYRKFSIQKSILFWPQTDLSANFASVLKDDFPTNRFATLQKLDICCKTLSRLFITSMFLKSERFTTIIHIIEFNYISYNLAFLSNIFFLQDWGKKYWTKKRLYLSILQTNVGIVFASFFKMENFIEISRKYLHGLQIHADGLINKTIMK